MTPQPRRSLRRKGRPGARTNAWQQLRRGAKHPDKEIATKPMRHATCEQHAGIATAVLIQGADPEMDCRADPAEAGLVIKEDGWVPVDESGTAFVVLEGGVAGEVSITCAYPNSDVFWATHAESVALSYSVPLG
ncbi:hypothetical protein HT102_10460 [Hoyosella sp. G463]|uniref:Uncharacterized protein n=1 Tax=Lolliginicoccus lacisalsi TaxID=2742202 RepID=A0A927JDN6_9ACTN|nr:hypothetical protein [Lolliginicoccus lacisalsi]MBD8506910.1 hypothetical protein [Lolliginicoccus lacisalsi]